MAAVGAIAADHGTCADMVMGRSQRHQVRAARQAAMFAMRERFDDPVDTIAATFGRSRRQVQYCIAALGRDRDDRGHMQVVQSVARAHGLSADELLHGWRHPHIVAARREAIAAAFAAFGGSPAGLASALGLDQTTARSHLRERGLA